MSRLERSKEYSSDLTALVSSDRIIQSELVREIDRRKSQMTSSELNAFIDLALDSDPHTQVRVADIPEFVKSLPWVTESDPKPEVDEPKPYAREDLLPFNQHNPNVYMREDTQNPFEPDMWD